MEIQDMVRLETPELRENMIAKIKLVMGPLNRLRCIPKPRLSGIYQPCSRKFLLVNEHSIRAEVSRLSPDDFDALAKEWEHCVGAEAPFRVLPKSPMYKLFMEFKALHEKLAKVIPHMGLGGQRLLLHPARVAREREDIRAFRYQFEQLMLLPDVIIGHDDLRREVESAAQRMTEMMAHLETQSRPCVGKLTPVRPC